MPLGLGLTTDDFSDDLFSAADHAWLDSLDEAHARIFAAEQGYDLVDDNGMLTDWWGYCWMILAEKRGLLTPENRAAARAAIEDKYLSAPNVIGVIVVGKVIESSSWPGLDQDSRLVLRKKARGARVKPGHDDVGFIALPRVSPLPAKTSAPRSRASHRG